MELPFELKKGHKTSTIYSWRRIGLDVDNFEEIYQKYIHCKECELCGKQLPNTKDRQMDHCHKTGKFRNILCKSCNMSKFDRKSNDNISGHKLIYYHKATKCKQGFYWLFKIWKDGKEKHIKSSVNLDKLIEFRDKWIKENNYYC